MANDREAVVQVAGLRVILRDPSATDLDVLAYWLEPNHRWQELDGPVSDFPDPSERATILAERRALVAAPVRPVPRQILSIASNDDGEMLGQVTWQVSPGDSDTATPGLNVVIYNPDLWGYGLGYEALGLWVDYLLAADPQLSQLELRTWNRNQGMMRLAHKLGFDEATPQRQRRGFGFLVRKPESLRFVLPRESWSSRFSQGFVASLNPDE